MLNVIDGYNFIFKIPRLEGAVERSSLEKAREELLSLLARYKLITNQDFTVVFDGREGVSARPHKTTLSGDKSYVLQGHYGR